MSSRRLYVYAYILMIVSVALMTGTYWQGTILPYVGAIGIGFAIDRARESGKRVSDD